MKKEARVLTLHPEGKKGVNIDKEKYRIVRDAILGVLKEEGTVTFNELMKRVHTRLRGRFRGSIGWYMTTVKLDMEARKQIVCDRGSSPQTVRLGRVR
ncbi:MAG: hypothetical protein OEM41_02925 [Ignavibacteria bacterium]|nr:hypothetical protein [Ignavibacteria bacterium]